MRSARAYVAILAVFAANAFATVTPLPGSTPQIASTAGVEFANPVTVRVTDERGSAVAGATVTWFVPPFGAQIDAAGCIFDLGYSCSRTAGSDGMVSLGRFRAAGIGTMVLRVAAGNASDREAYGSSDIVLRAGQGDLPMRITVVAGDHQSAHIGNLLPNLLFVRVTRADGTPVAGQTVFFNPASVGDSLSGIEASGSDVSPLVVTTDVNGNAASNPVFAGWAPGNRSITATTFDADQHVSVSTSAGFTALNNDGAQSISLQNLWWSGPLENGWGMSVVQHADQLFTVLFVYDSQGNPVWYVVPGGSWTRGVGSYFNGSVYSTRGSPFWAYDASRLQVSFAGTTLLAFRGESAGSLTLNVGRLSQSKSLVQQDFTGTAPSPMTGLGDMWWGGPDQNGWGIAILEQFGGLFSIWFTYDDAGFPTWFVMPAGEWRDASTYSGVIYQTTGSAWLGATYDSGQLRVATAGAYTLRFADAQHATFDYNVRGRSGRLALVRQPF